jgi:hypothetical protein|tara:strand:+ start:3149 stop:3331 length:183 start_codon:yes stop_codon:yes gene_type:complete
LRSKVTDEAVIDEEELAEAPTLISEIEAFLKVTSGRELISATEVQDFLLDLRNLADPKLN